MPARASQASPLVPVVLAAIAIGGAIAWLHKPLVATDDPLGACPADAFLVAKLDMAKLRATSLGPIADQVVRGLVPLPPTSSPSPCDTSKVDTMAIVVPEGEDRSDVGLALKLRLGSGELARCAATLDRGHASKRPEQAGAFMLFASGDARADTLAAADNGMIVLAPRAWALSMAAAASGRSPSGAAPTSPPHADVLRALGSRTLLVSIALPKTTRARIRREMGSELEGDRSAMEGVLGVEAVGAAIDVVAKTGETELVAELRCDTISACAAVNDLVAKKKKSWADNPVVRLLGLGQAADAIAISLHGQRLEVKTHLATDDLRGAIERVLAWRKSRSPATPATPATMPATPTPPAPTEGDGGAVGDGG